MRTLLLVPARGGSKGFPGKNLQMLGEQTLLERALRTLMTIPWRHPRADTALRLSTDSPVIAAVAAKLPLSMVGRTPDGLKLRPDLLATDQASLVDVALWEMGEFNCDRVLLLQPTTPLLTGVDIDNLWCAGDSSPSAALVTELDHPIEWSLRSNEHGQLRPVYAPEQATARRQELGKVYRPVGAFLCTRDILREHRAFVVPGVTAGVHVHRHHAIDIDTPEDLALCQALLP